MSRSTLRVALLVSACFASLPALLLAEDPAATSEEDIFGVEETVTPASDEDVFGAEETVTQSSGEDVFGAEETVTTTTEQTQSAAPRDDLLTSAVPWITGTFTGGVGVNATWKDPWGGELDLLAPASHGLTGVGTAISLGFVARPAASISVAGMIEASYPFTQQIPVTEGGVTTTYTVANLAVWSLYAKFNWSDVLFFTFGKQPVNWGTGYFFSPADDIFAQSAVDLDDPTAEREGPLAIKLHFPIPRTMHNLYFYAVLPDADTASDLAELLPEDIAVAAKAEVLIGNTELALGGYYQRSQRPQAILMGTSGIGDFNFFAEGLVAFPGTESEPYVGAAAVDWGSWPLALHSDYTVSDRSGDVIFSATAGAMYTNQDWNFTAVAQYLYNGFGYADVTLGDLVQAAVDRTVSRPEGEPTYSFASLLGSMSGLGQIGKHYGALYLSWSSLFDSDFGFSTLALANFSDLSGYVRPTVSFSGLDHVTFSGSASLSWGGDGTEYADAAGLLAAIAEGDFDYITKPTMTLAFDVSIGSTSF